MKSLSLRFRVFERDRFTCVYCGRSAPHVVLEADHKRPRSKGGPDSLENLVTACRECNRGKAARPLKVQPKRIDDAQVTPQATLPCLDSCSACIKACGRDGLQLHAAVSEEPARNGYFAFYRCHRGHTWRTYWSDNWRTTPREVA